MQLAVLEDVEHPVTAVANVVPRMLPFVVEAPAAGNRDGARAGVQVTAALVAWPGRHEVAGWGVSGPVGAPYRGQVSSTASSPAGWAMSAQACRWS